MSMFCFANVGPTDEYNPVEGFVNSEDSDNSQNDLQSPLEKKIDSNSACQIKVITDDNKLLDKLCTLYIESKLT